MTIDFTRISIEPLMNPEGDESFTWFIEALAANGLDAPTVLDVHIAPNSEDGKQIAEAMAIVSQILNRRLREIVGDGG